MELLSNSLAGNVLTGDEADIGKFVVIGIVCVVLVIGVTILGKIASKSDEETVEKEEKTEE